MGSEIASLYAKLGLDSTQFQKGLTDSKTKLSGVGGAIQKLNDSSLGRITQSVTGFSLSSVSAAGAVAGLINATRQIVNETEAYVTSITDMSRVLGISTEDTSRLVQASDDLFITQEKLNTALLAASRQGIDVSIAGLKNLSAQYLALNPGVERAQFLMQTFGRTGADMGKLMEVGAEGIDKATAAISANLIVTGKSAEQVIAYKQSVDALTDSWTGFKMEIGMGVIPALVDLLNGLQGLSGWWNKQDNKNLMGAVGVPGGLSPEQIAAIKLQMGGYSAAPAVTPTANPNKNYTATPSGYSSSRGTTQTPHASGGSFLIPMSYGYEGFQMGNGDTASGGETVTVTPKGKAPSGGQIILTDDQLKKIGEASGNATAVKLMQLGVLR